YLEDINRLSKTLMAREMAAAKRGVEFAEREKMAKDIDSAKKKFLDAVKGYVTELRTGRELEEIIKYDSSDVLKSVIDRLDNLNSTGIFRSTLPPFNPRSAVWHYDIKALSDDEKKL